MHLFTKKIEQSDNYFGTIVEDPYRWLECTDSEDVNKWIEEQNLYTSNYLDKIPFRNKIKKRLTEIWNYPKYSQPIKTPKNYFFFRNDGLQNQSVLYYQKDLSTDPEVFVDPNAFSDDGSILLNSIYASLNGDYLAYSISINGSDWQEIFVIETETRKKLKDHIKWVKYSDVSWYKDGFYYCRYDEPIDANIHIHSVDCQKVYYHQLGTEQDEDVLIFEDKVNPEQFYSIAVTADERYTFLGINVNGKEGNSLYFKDFDKPDLQFKPLVIDVDYIYIPIENIGSELLIVTNNNAPGFKLMKADLNDPNASWTTILPERDIVLNEVNFVGGKIIANYTKDVISHVFVFEIDGTFLNEVKMPASGTVFGFNGKKNDKQVFYTFTSFTYPQEIFIYDVDKQESLLFKKSEVKFDPADYETKQVFFKSKDETSVPMFIVHKKGLHLNGNNPAFLTGYGGFGNIMGPGFYASRIVLLENGGVFALANLRGGGEFGEAWHKSGMLLKKQNVFDDFIAAAEYLIAEKYTSPDKLAIAGSSNGGLLIGAVLNQRPDICKVAFPDIGVMDMLRFQKFTAGQFWTSEYGSSDDSTHFKNLYSYSPLHNIKEENNYPSVLISTADHDDRVVPSHSFKYAATLQEKNKGTNPILLRVGRKSGHSLGFELSRMIDQNTDMWSFMFHNMGLEPEY